MAKSDFKKKDRVAVKMTDSAKGNIFINSQVNGQLELGGQNNSFFQTNIGKFSRKHPFWSSVIAVGTILGIITGVMSLAQYVGIIPDSLSIRTDIGSHVSTTTPNLLDVYKRAFSYDILADRQDFLTKYVGSDVYGDGSIEEISILRDKYILEITTGGYTILCPQGKTEDFGKVYPLLKGKRVRFSGIFTYSTYFGYGDDKIVIEPCSFEIR